MKVKWHGKEMEAVLTTEPVLRGSSRRVIVIVETGEVLGPADTAGLEILKATAKERSQLDDKDYWDDEL